MASTNGSPWARRIAAATGAACMAVSLLSFAQPEGSLPQVTVHQEVVKSAMPQVDAAITAAMEGNEDEAT